MSRTLEAHSVAFRLFPPARVGMKEKIVAGGTVAVFWAVSFLLVYHPGCRLGVRHCRRTEASAVFPAVGGLLAGTGRDRGGGGRRGCVGGPLSAAADRADGGGCGVPGVAGDRHARSPGGAAGSRRERVRVMAAAGSERREHQRTQPEGLPAVPGAAPAVPDPNARWPVAVQILVLGLVHVASCAVIYTGIGTGARRVLRARPTATRALTHFTGAAMIVIGLVLLIEQLVAWWRREVTPDPGNSNLRRPPVMEDQTQPEPGPPEIRARIRASFEHQGLMRHLGAGLGDIEPGRVQIVLPSRPEITQQDNYIHAGATSAIADSAGGYAAFTLYSANTVVLTVEYKMNLVAPAVGDHLEAIGTVLKSGRTLTVLPTRGVRRSGRDAIARRSRTANADLRARAIWTMRPSDNELLLAAPPTRQRRSAASLPRLDVLIPPAEGGEPLWTA